MKAILTNDNSFRTIEKLADDSNFECRYAGGEKYPFNDFETVITITFENAINSLIKAGYKLETITA
ncbi:MAG: hypothetical protein K6F71_04470 [Ruminococcus sp.]|uniref:hypothetical protein n=1 Tax=Ruminococcus sp. TaxID=41978 RepID=UPI0025E3B3D8|nr:hypothetical protein [Ruminococcus sp.]MCR5540075.1 hypothetical protein [Ruminococcus sp.]